MSTGIAYRTIGVSMVLGGVLYLYIATHMNTDVTYIEDAIIFQPIPTEAISEKDIPVINISSTFGRKKTSLLDIKLENENVRTRQVIIGNREQNKIRTNRTATHTTTAVNSPVKVNTIYRVGGEQKSQTQLPNAGPNTDGKHVTVLSNKTIVLIVAYMRTGSTLTGSLFQEYPGTFYLFEPIRFLTGAFNNLARSNDTHLTLKYIHGKYKKYTASENITVTLGEINNWLTCKLDDVSLPSLQDEFHKYYTKTMKNFYYCRKRSLSKTNIGRIQPHLRQYYDKSINADNCLKMAISSCQKAPLITLKFIRLRMDHITKLLPAYPNMKIIHLVRDPRGVLNSRLKINATASTVYKVGAKNYCTALSNDLTVSKRILRQYPDRLKIISYENMAEIPLETARELVEFGGLEFVKSMQDFIGKQTSSSRDSCAYCTQRRNSNVTANKWRLQLDPIQARYIYDTCNASNNVLGYLPLLSVEKLRDKNIPSRYILDIQRELLRNDYF